jgi:hypothetical protein
VGTCTRQRQAGNIRKAPKHLQILSGQEARIEALAEAVQVGEMRPAPRPKTLKYGLEGLSVTRHLILHPEPWLRRGYAGDEVYGLGFSVGRSKSPLT